MFSPALKTICYCSKFFAVLWLLLLLPSNVRRAVWNLLRYLSIFFLFPWTCVCKCHFSCFSPRLCSKTTWDRSSATWAWRGSPRPRARSPARRCSSPAWCCSPRSSPATSSLPRPPQRPQRSPAPPSRAPGTPWASPCSHSRDLCSSPCHRYKHGSYSLPRAAGKNWPCSSAQGLFIQSGAPCRAAALLCFWGWSLFVINYFSLLKKQQSQRFSYLFTAGKSHVLSNASWWKLEIVASTRKVEKLAVIEGIYVV